MTSPPLVLCAPAGTTGASRGGAEPALPPARLGPARPPSADVTLGAWRWGFVTDAAVRGGVWRGAGGAWRSVPCPSPASLQCSVFVCVFVFPEHYEVNIVMNEQVC